MKKRKIIIVYLIKIVYISKIIMEIKIMKVKIKNMKFAKKSAI